MYSVTVRGLIPDADGVELLLGALAQQLQLADEAFDLVIVGGAALLEQGFVSRATADIDVLAICGLSGLMSADPLPEALIRARDRVTRDLRVDDPEWLKAGPAAPVRFAARIDQVFFKFWAAVDHNGPGRHLTDLQALNPTGPELIRAARWTREHDPSQGHLSLLRAALDHLGVRDADLGE